ncbi:hypothetical protein [Streptococcus acidominimus]|uniref:Uncharacterized protein n=1 Tax=Streptococcus acidominimus TaxID=1326 RepID=A0A1Q8EFW4_STRAI|nr:hypothetical protein [Streptococcus acidominimus]OLF50646.1 hypothetical protein BU200_01085 [Streptococcus acidominimus]SUN05102.1 Uncharacterised protein [Streptococcus acidominimus]
MINFLSKNRFWMALSAFLVFSIIFSYFAVPYLISFKNHSDFVGDVLNFSSILTGFLGALLGILVSISKTSKVMINILDSHIAKMQFVFSLVIPFALGIVNVLVCMFYRLYLVNELENLLLAHIFVVSAINFVLMSSMVTYFIFTIYFRETSKAEEIKNVKPKLKK